MAITPIPALPSVFAPTPTAPVEPAVAPSTQGQGVSGFAAFLDQASQLETNANAQAVKVATGDAASVHQFTAAAAKAQLAVELTAAVRNRAVDAFNEIMRMQV